MSTLKSMTGYGRASLEREGMQVVVEISAVNRKHLDINLALPRHFIRFDPEIRKAVGSRVFRGHLSLRIGVAFVKSAPVEVRANIALAEKLFQGWKQIAEALHVKETPSLSVLEGESDLFTFEENALQMEACGKLILEAVEMALGPFLKMKEQEGKVLELEIRERLDAIAKRFQQIHPFAAGATEKYRVKLLEKLKSSLPEIDSDEGRVLREIALFADRIDISEELVRFDAHLNQFYALLTSSEAAAGKKAEFILQELAREINTIGSKSSEIEITKSVIDIKSELEKIREQIQNVE
jgi:uncharacterized protein (TIGR00255 family)